LLEVGMSDRVIYVVGEGFAPFATGRLFISLRQLRQLLAHGAETVGAHIVVLPGQGLDESDIAEILTLAAASPRRDQFDFTEWYHRPKRAALRRHDARDILISAPRRVAENVFGLDLLIDDACGLMVARPPMSDPRRLVLPEAARQCALAVAAVLYPGWNCPMVRVEEDATWHGAFIMALDAQIRCTVRPSAPSPVHRVQLDIAIDQGDVPVAAFSAGLTPAFDEGALPAVA
jgi:hypothetical protein